MMDERSGISQLPSVPAEPPVRFAAGTEFGPYRVEGPLGAGGMGEVYRASDTRLDRAVAIKVLPAHLADDPDARTRFEQEARAVAALNHPHICTLYDVGPNYMVTELIEGETLRDWLRRGPALARRLESARQVLSALGAAHRAGIVHRDLKPENVMVRFDGYVKVLDFGLAKRMPPSDTADTAVSLTGVSQPGRLMGTVSYMSPEQVRGHGLDQRSDLFAFGIMLYEMLTGVHPWPHRSALETLHAILYEERPPAPAGAIDPQLDAVLDRLLQKSPADRYASADSVLAAIASQALDADASASSPTVPLVTIAVLPFMFLNEVEERSALSLGFADALITMLGNLDNVAVKPTSAILGCAPGLEPARACRELGVRYALQGNVQKIGAQWRVSIHLFDATAQKVVLSEKHDFHIESAFEVQDEIGRRLVDSMQARLPIAARKARERYSSDPEAYEAFMHGLRESYGHTAEALADAIRHLTVAIERDPEFALAHAILSHAAMIMHFSFDPQPAWLDRAEQHCQRGLALDPALPEAHLARAWILWSPARNFQHAEAIAALERALAGQPNLERAHNRMAAICLHIGRLEEARIAHEHAQRSNPKTRTMNLGSYYLYRGDFARFAALVEETSLERSDRLSLLEHSMAALYTDNLVAVERHLALAPAALADEPLLVSLQGMLYARHGQTARALECVRRALESPRSFGHTHHTYYQIACVHALLGDTEKAIGWLERTVATGFPCWPFFRVDPHLSAMRADARFERMVAGLEEKYTALEIHRL